MHRTPAEDELVRDVGVAETLSNQPQHLDFGWSQTGGPRTQDRREALENLFRPAMGITSHPPGTSGPGFGPCRLGQAAPDLVGDWLYVLRTPPLHSTDTLYVEAGTEVFKGCIDRNHNGRCGAGDVSGELRPAFLYWAYYDLDGNLIKGQCTHPITGGTEAFVGARGLLDMVDWPVGDEVKTTYRGRDHPERGAGGGSRAGRRDGGHHRPPDDGRAEPAGLLSFVPPPLSPRGVEDEDS